MTESRPPYVATSAHGETISIVPETDWEARILAAVRLLRDGRKDCIILYDWRTNTVRIAPFLPRESIKLD